LSTGSIWNCVIVHFLNNFISLTISAFIPQVDQWYISLGYYNWLTGFGSIVVGMVLLISLLFILYKVSNKDDSHYANSISGDGYTLYVRAEDVGVKKQNIIKQLFVFWKHLFSKSGLRRISNSLGNVNNQQFLGKSQNLTVVWISLALVCIYWFINFLMGII